MKRLFLLLLICIQLSASAFGQMQLTYWLNGANPVTRDIGNGLTSFDIDASTLPAGLHQLNMQLSGSMGYSSPLGTFFIKSAGNASNVLSSIDGGEPIITETPLRGNIYALELEATNLSQGIHSIASALVNAKGEISDFKESYFFKVPTTADLSSLKGYFIIDDNIEGVTELTGSRPLYEMDINMSNLTAGIHSVSVFLANSTGYASIPFKSFFIKIPNGGPGICRYEYWIDDDMSIKTSVNLENSEKTFSLIKMIEIPLGQFRSSDYEFKLEPEGPSVYGVHHLNFHALDGDNRTVAFSKEFVESRIRIPVEVQALLEKTTKSAEIGSIDKNEIKWLILNAELGDSLTFALSSPATIDVFTPAGKKVYSKSGYEAKTVNGFHAPETGSYYVGIHDSNNQNAITLRFNHIDKYAIIEERPKSTAASRVFAFDIYGNGLNYLKNLKLSAGNGDYIAEHIHKYDNGKAIGIFNLQDAPCGEYSLTATYENGTETAEVTVEKALNIVEPKGSVNLKVSAARSVFGTTLNDVLIKITNPSNVPLWGIPLNLAAEADGSEVIKLNFKDFIPNMPEDGKEDWEMVMTDNLLGTGRRGGLLQMILPYIGPKETKELTIVYQMPLTVHIPTYVWAGRPWSDEYQEIQRLAEEGKPAIPENVNYISAKLVNMLVQLKEYSASVGSDHSGMQKAPGHYVDLSQVNAVTDLVSEIGERAHIDMSALNNAQTVANQSVAIGHSLGGIVNGLRLRNLDAVIEAYGIDLSSGEYQFLADYRNDLIQSMPDPNCILNDAFDLDLPVNDCMGRIQRSNATNANPMPTASDIVQMTPCDPNDIIGYTDPSGGKYVGNHVTQLPYTIEFENDPDLATAPAHVIKVTDIFDPEIFDMSTFGMKEIKVGNKSLRFNGESELTKTLDMRPEINSVAQISLSVDKKTGKTEWTFESLDPMTLEKATEMIQGILPVNIDGNGCGEIKFDISLREGLSSGKMFGNKASIIFDSNDPIETPNWENTLDYDFPSARITSAGSTDSKTFSFDIESSDQGAGIWSYDLYFRPSATGEWEIARGAIPENERTITFDKEMKGAFFIVPIDGAGNRPHSGPDSVLWGDADDNGMIDSNDVVVIRNNFIGKKLPINKTNAEITMDYIIDGQDAVVVRKAFLNSKAHKIAKRTRKYKQIR